MTTQPLPDLVVSTSSQRTTFKVRIIGADADGLPVYELRTPLRVYTTERCKGLPDRPAAYTGTMAIIGPDGRPWSRMTSPFLADHADISEQPLPLHDNSGTMGACIIPWSFPTWSPSLDLPICVEYLRTASTRALIRMLHHSGSIPRENAATVLVDRLGIETVERWHWSRADPNAAQAIRERLAREIELL